MDKAFNEQRAFMVLVAKCKIPSQVRTRVFYSMYSGLQEHVTIKCIVGKDFIVAVNDYP